MIIKRLALRWLTAIGLWLVSLPVAWASDSDSSDMSNMLWNLYDSLDQVYVGLIATCYLTGIMVCFIAFLKIKKFGHVTAFMHNTSGMLKPLAQFLIGVLLIYVPSIIDVFIYTLWGYSDVQNTNSWAQQYAGTSWEDYIIPLVGLIQVIGLVSFMRGWFLLNKLTSDQPPPGSLSRGVMHIITGILGINITGTIDVINYTLGL